MCFEVQCALFSAFLWLRSTKARWLYAAARLSSSVNYEERGRTTGPFLGNLGHYSLADCLATLAEAELLSDFHRNGVDQIHLDKREEKEDGGGGGGASKTQKALLFELYLMFW